MQSAFGITCYSTTCKGIPGSIKRRYTDFIVEEIQENNRVCETKRFVGNNGEELLEIPENPEHKQQLHLDLEKINKELNFVIRKLSRFLQCSKKRIGYAGLKDKRGVTCQRISIFEPNLERLTQFSAKGIELRNAEWSSERIELGNLSGNKFTTVIRNIGMEKKEIEKMAKACFTEMQKHGIANFFGEQRFGSLRAVTHLVGKEIVEKNFEEAVMLYLTATFPEEKEEIKQPRISLSKTRDFAKAIREFPKECIFERAMISHLCNNPTDYIGAIRALPKQMRYLFTHALQSHLFNQVVSERIEQGIGLEKTAGDILLNNHPTAPLFGFETSFAGKKPGEIEKKILEQNNLQTKDFKIRELPELSSKGARKGIVLFPQEMKILETGEDEFFQGKNFLKIGFKLEKGNYATTVLREIMKS